MCCSSRHGYHTHDISAETYPEDADRYCICLGPGNGVTDNPAIKGKCCGAQSGEDKLCDRCRENCGNLAVDVDSKIVETIEPGHIDLEQTQAVPLELAHQ